MNRKEWLELCKVDKKAAYFWYNKAEDIKKTLQYNSDPNAIHKHHLFNTPEQIEYNRNHYEMWGFNLDGTFEYGKYIIFVTPEEHSLIHAQSELTRELRIKAARLNWENPAYREKMLKIFKASVTDATIAKRAQAIRDSWDDERRRKYSEMLSGEGNPFYGKHHSDETKEKYFIGENNPMYGVSLSEETRKKISEANKGHIVSEEARSKISEASRRNWQTEEYRKKMEASSEIANKKRSESLKGRIFTDEHKNKISLSNTGKKRTDEQRKKISESTKAAMTDEVKEKLRNSRKGIHPSEETRSKISQSAAKHRQMVASKYKEYKESGGNLSWNDFQKEFATLFN